MLFGLPQKAWIAIGAVALVGGGAAITGVVVADGDDFDPVPAPDWKAGYNFAYEVNGEVEYLVDVPSENISESERATFGPFPISKEILSTQYEHNNQPVYVGAATLPIGNILSGSFFGEDHGDLAAFATADRQYDLSPIPVMPDGGCSSNDCASGGLLFGPDNPFTYLSFPLTPDKRWEQQADLPIEDLFADAELSELDGIQEVHMVGEVTGKDTITLPGGLGETDAIRVDFSYTPVGLQKKISEAREQMEDYGITVERLTVQLGLHEIAHYSPEYQAVVRDEWVIRALVDIAVSAEYQGQSFKQEGYFEASVHAVAELVGAELVEKPEMEPLQILGKLSGRDAIRDATGQSRVVGSHDYSIDLVASAREVNAAEAEQVQFTATLDGVEALPEDHTLRFNLMVATGPYSATRHHGFHAPHAHAASGQSFSQVFDEPGVYTMYAETVDAEGRLMAQDTITIVAHYNAIEEAECRGIGQFVTYSCDWAKVPVRSGIQSLIVDADSRDWEPFVRGTLVLTDPKGKEYKDESGAGRIQIDDFSGKPMGDWLLQWRSNLGVMEEVDYGIFLDFGSIAPEAAEPAPEGDGGDGGEGGHARGGGLEGGNLGILFQMLRPIDNTLADAKDGDLAGMDAERIGLRSLLG